MEWQEIGYSRDEMGDEDMPGDIGESGGHGEDVITFGEHGGEGGQYPGPPRGVGVYDGPARKGPTESGPLVGLEVSFLKVDYVVSFSVVFDVIEDVSLPNTPRDREGVARERIDILRNQWVVGKLISIGGGVG
jgi:hypothetical protein